LFLWGRKICVNLQKGAIFQLSLRIAQHALRLLRWVIFLVWFLSTIFIAYCSFQLEPFSVFICIACAQYLINMLASVDFYYIEQSCNGCLINIFSIWRSGTGLNSCWLSRKFFSHVSCWVWGRQWCLWWVCRKLELKVHYLLDAVRPQAARMEPPLMTTPLNQYFLL
jgi:hypothetical protein